MVGGWLAGAGPRSGTYARSLPHSCAVQSWATQISATDLVPPTLNHRVAEVHTLEFLCFLSVYADFCPFALNWATARPKTMLDLFQHTIQNLCVHLGLPITVHVRIALPMILQWSVHTSACFEVGISHLVDLVLTVLLLFYSLTAHKIVPCGFQNQRK